jgi:hypothetical protein
MHNSTSDFTHWCFLVLFGLFKIKEIKCSNQAINPTIEFNKPVLLPDEDYSSKFIHNHVHANPA